MEDGVLNNRELAGLIWLGIILAYIVSRPERGRLAKSLGAVAVTLATPKLLVPMVMFVGWLAGGVWLADEVGLWEHGLLKPALLWSCFVGIGLYFGVTKAIQQESFFRSALLTTIGVSAFIEFFVSFQSFPLVVELIAQPVVALCAMTTIVAARRPGQEVLVKATNSVVVGFGFAAVAWVAWNLVTRWNEIDVGGVIREMLMLVWLTPIALAFVYFLALYVGYEQAFGRIDWKANGRSTWRQKVAMLSVAGVRLKRLRRIDGAGQLRVADEATFKGARRVLAVTEQP